jgi:hypothetical protein
MYLSTFCLLLLIWKKLNVDIYMNFRVSLCSWRPLPEQLCLMFRISLVKITDKVHYTLRMPCINQPSATVWGDGASVVPRSPLVVDAEETFPHWAAAGGLEETRHVSKAVRRNYGLLVPTTTTTTTTGTAATIDSAWRAKMTVEVIPFLSSSIHYSLSSLSLSCIEFPFLSRPIVTPSSFFLLHDSR